MNNMRRLKNTMEIADFFISEEEKIKNVLHRMDAVGHGILLVGKENRLKAVITDGDIRRAMLRGYDENSRSGDIANYTPFFLNLHEANNQKIKDPFKKKRIKAIPIIGNDGMVQRIEFDNGKVIYKKACNDIKVIIMAGGKGTRLLPLTDVLPKPLIPVGDETILEHIIDRFSVLGFWDFNIIINYKKELIKAFFSETVYNNKHNVSIKLWDEENFQGTAGGLKLLQEEIKSTFILSNCDILVDADYEHIINRHKENNNYITMICAPQIIQIPYGTVRTDSDNNIIALEEKPSIECLINTGMYVLEPKVIELIQNGEFLHMPDLIQRCVGKGYKAGAYEIAENGWLDMGEINKLKYMGSCMS